MSLAMVAARENESWLSGYTTMTIPLTILNVKQQPPFLMTSWMDAPSMSLDDPSL
jgi:hypothetical protein